MKDDILFTALKFSLVLMTLTLLLYFFTEMLQDTKAEIAAQNGVHIGTVTDKKIVNAERGLFTSSDKRYQLVIVLEYEYDGENKTAKEYVDVEKDVYLSYNVGDTFDIHNPVVKESEDSQC